MKRQSSKNPLLRISKNGEMRLRNKVGHAILTENTYEDRALNTKLQRLSQHRSRHEQYITSRQLEFANKRISASEERPHTMATRSRLPSLAFPLIESSSGRRRAFSQTCYDDNDISHEKPTAEKAKWEKAITLVRLAVQSRQPRDADDSQFFVTQQTRQNPIPNYPKRVLPPLTAEKKPRSHRRKRNAKRLRSEERRVGKECRSRWSPYH